MRSLLLTNEVSRNNGWATVGYYIQKHLGCRDLEIVTQRSARNEQCGWNVHPLASVDDYLDIVPLLNDFQSIKKRLRGAPFDCIICNIEPYLPLASLLARSLRTARGDRPKLVLIGHGTYIYHPFLKPLTGALLRRLAASVDVLVVPSAFTAAKAAEWYRGTVRIVPWGVDGDLYHPVDGVERERAFISVGQQKERKGTGYLIEAFKGVVSRFPDSRLYLVGPTNPKYVDMAARFGLSEKICFTGLVSHEALLRYYSRSMCHVLPSVNAAKAFEGYGLVHLEANACGLPTIGSRGTANDEIIIEGETGYLCGQGDVDELAAHMTTILDNPSSWQRMSQRAREHARTVTWADSIQSLNDILCSI